MKAAAVFLVFLLLAVALTWPLALHINTAIENDGDLPIGLWQITWIAQKLFTAPRAIFDVPFYYPHEGEFSAGYHNYLLGVIYAPFYYAVGRPVAAFNILYITTFALNAFAMYLFVRYLTRSGFAGFISGLIFAFSPFRFGLYGFTAFQSTYWMPFSLLFMGLYFERESSGGRGLRFLFLGVLFYLFQFLTDIGLGIFFAFVFFPYVAFMLLRSSGSIGRGTYLKLAGALLVFVLLVAFINRAYLPRGEKISTGRSLREVQELSADVSSYLGSPPSNLLYGRLTRRFWVHGMDMNLFGATAYVLAVCGLLGFQPTGRVLYVRFAGRKHRLCACRRPRIRKNHTPWFFFLLFIIIVLISFGPEIHLFRRPVCPGPYMFLYRFLPFLRALRIIGWVAIAALFCLSVISGYGAAVVLAMSGRLRKDRRAFAGAVLILIIAAESVHYPPTTFGWPFVRLPAELPAVYRWLAEEGDEGAIIELPMPWEPEEVAGGSYGLDSMYMYWSLFHGRRLVNGVSAFYPPEYQTIVNQMKLFPSRETIDILKFLGVRYVVIHTDKAPRFKWQKEIMRRYPEARHNWREAIQRTAEFEEELVLEAHFGYDYVYEVAGGPPTGEMSPDSFRSSVPRGAWRVSATDNDRLAGRAIDGSPQSAWVSAVGQRSGVSFKIDLGAEYTLTGMVMEPRNVNEYAKNPRIEVSTDGRTWRHVDYGEPYLDIIARLIGNPSDKALRMELPDPRARYVRITLTRFDNLFPWSIAELNLYRY